MRSLIALALLAALGSPLAAQRTYWHATVAQLASGTFPHTHVELDSVVVDYKAAEADSDFHIRLRDPRDTMPSHFIVAECIPLIPCRHPRLGETISVWGIYRKDSEHLWAEVHPVEKLAP